MACTMSTDDHQTTPHIIFGIYRRSGMLSLAFSQFKSFQLQNNQQHSKDKTQNSRRVCKLNIVIVHLRIFPLNHGHEFLVHDLHRFKLLPTPRLIINKRPPTAYPASFKCNPSIKYLLRFCSSIPAACQSTPHTSTSAMSNSVATSLTASAYALVVSNSRSSATGGILACKVARR